MFLTIDNYWRIASILATNCPCSVPGELYQMPTIEKRMGDGIVTFRARVRIKGFPEQQKTFKRKTDAQMWAQQTETAIRKGEFKNVVKSAAQNTLVIVIERYREEILPAKSPGTRRSETAHLNFWEKELGKYALVVCTT